MNELKLFRTCMAIGGVLVNSIHFNAMWLAYFMLFETYNQYLDKR